MIRELLTHLPAVGTCGVIALLAGPLAQLPINLGAWLLDWLSSPSRAALPDSVDGFERRPVSVNSSWKNELTPILLEERTDTNSA